ANFSYLYVHGNPQQEFQKKGVIDSGCSRHMTRNMSYISEYEEIDSGYVAFGRDLKGGKIIGKGKISIGKLDFEDVYWKRIRLKRDKSDQNWTKTGSVVKPGKVKSSLIG
nr:ribonuclease H-like domain-containing protein [Tanacetum cinerariifolium]